MSGALVSGRHRAPLADGHEVTEPNRDEEQPPPSLLRVLRALVRPRSIRARLSRILLLSLVLVLVALGLMVHERLDSYRGATAVSRVVTLTLDVQDLAQSLRNERGMTAGLLGGAQYYAPSVDAQRMKTDTSLVTLTNTLANPKFAGPAVADIRSGLAKLSGLTEVRDQVSTGHAQPAAVFAYYTDASRALNNLELGLDQAEDPALRQGLQALYALSDLNDYTDRERGLLNGVFSANSFLPGQYAQFTQVRVDKQSALQIFDHFAIPAQRQAVDAVLHSPVATRAASNENIAVATMEGKLAGHADAQEHWWDQMTLIINDLRTVQQSVGAEVSARAGALERLALRQLVVLLALAVLAITIEAALLIGAARSIIRPLRVLATEADDVSAHRLPAAVAALENAREDQPRAPVELPVSVPANASSEIRRTARAVSRLQRSAISLAGEQAMIRRNITTSLANLGRRNQNLVRRQLSLISEFEREELDPSMLAKMFQLDHLATRMRRNAESLLVLVGESGRRSWSRPMPIVDVVRAALSEVEDYRRVEIKRIDEVHIAGAATADLAHILAELIENGLSFSPPDVEVEVYGRRMGESYTIAVVDHGTGMQPDALARANARLNDEENFLVAPTRFLGHYVVGRLATRLGIEVRLVPAPITGVTARLLLPPETLVDPVARSGGDPNAAKTATPLTELDGPRTTPPQQMAHPDERASNPSSASEPEREPPAPMPHHASARSTGNLRVRVDVPEERTRNGLVKRQARADRTARRTPPTPAPRPAGAETPRARERTPEDISAKLSSYRAGHQRGAHGGLSTPIQPPPTPIWPVPESPAAGPPPEPATPVRTESTSEPTSDRSHRAAVIPTDGAAAGAAADPGCGALGSPTGPGNGPAGQNEQTRESNDSSSEQDDAAEPRPDAQPDQAVHPASQGGPA